jgi:hypothetical protein
MLVLELYVSLYDMEEILWEMKEKSMETID